MTVAARVAERPTLVRTFRVPHAAHYGYRATPGQGHDLDVWIVKHHEVPTVRQLSRLRVPSDAALLCGVNQRGVQTWTYQAKRPMSPGSCATCA